MTPDLIVGLAAVVTFLAMIVVVLLACRVVLRHLDHTQRIQRRQAGLSEIPRDKVPPREREPLPREIRELIAPWGSLHVRRGLEEDCHALRKTGTPWSEIRRMLEVEPAGEHQA